MGKVQKTWDLALCSFRGALVWELFVAAAVLAVLNLVSGLRGLWFVVMTWLACSAAGALLFYWHWHRVEAYIARQTKP